jgi:3-hydroxyacyl-CoA dehydrogenase/enoyl-CoA hydratase/3-hydroxybutyryl-CoA epimerase
MCKKGWLGQKSGMGFYSYRGKKKQPNVEIELMLESRRRTTVDASEIRDRLVLVMVNEAAACLGEGIAADAETIDLAMILGTGWAPHRGGPLRYADDRGLNEVVRVLEDLRKKLGIRFELCAELQRRTSGSDAFYRPVGGASHGSDSSSPVTCALA